MRKKILIIIMITVLLPIITNAKTCANDKISVSSITVEQKANNVMELDNASIDEKNIDLNISMTEVGDSLKYKIIIKNNSDEDYELSKDNFLFNTDYIDYNITTDDNSKIVKANTNKTIYLNMRYAHEVKKELLNKGIYNDKITILIPLTSGNIINNIKNPDTGLKYNMIILVIVLLLSIIICLIYHRKNKRISLFTLAGVTIIIPMSVYALCKYEIKINSIVKKNKKGYNPCSFDGEMEQGVTYTNGQYSYKYKQELVCDEICHFMNIDEDGWGVYLSNDNPNIGKTIDTKLCTTINGKSVISTRSLFEQKQLDSVILSNSDFSNISNMTDMFYGIRIPDLDLSNLDTSNTTNMTAMFAFSHVQTIDISNFDTSKVTKMDMMFQNSYATFINLANINTSNVTSMRFMFNNIRIDELDLSSFDTKNVTDMSNMFSRATIDVLDLSSFDTSNVTNMDNMFYDCRATIGYARTQEDADRFNSSPGKPSTLTFVVKS